MILVFASASEVNRVSLRHSSQKPLLKFSGNPVAAVAGLKTMEILRRDEQYARLREIGLTLQSVFSDTLASANIAHEIVGDPTLFDVVFTDKEVSNYRHTKAADAERNGKFNAALRNHGIFKSPGKCYPSLAITPEDLELTQNAVSNATAVLIG